MDFDMVIRPLVGGMMIGLSASLLLLFSGRIYGVSGIVAGALWPKRGDTAWRLAILLGMVFAGLTLLMLHPLAFERLPDTSGWRYIAAGLLVGFGTQLGSGCTSGHGVCGMSRFSPRSAVATLTFIFAGIVMVGIMRQIGVY